MSTPRWASRTPNRNPEEPQLAPGRGAHGRLRVHLRAEVGGHQQAGRVAGERRLPGLDPKGVSTGYEILPLKFNLSMAARALDCGNHTLVELLVCGLPSRSLPSPQIQLLDIQE